MPIYLVSGWTKIEADDEQQASLVAARLLQNTGWRNGTIDDETIEETESTKNVEVIPDDDRARWARWDEETEGSPIGLRITREVEE